MYLGIYTLLPKYKLQRKQDFVLLPTSKSLMLNGYLVWFGLVSFQRRKFVLGSWFQKYIVITSSKVLCI